MPKRSRPSTTILLFVCISILLHVGLGYLLYQFHQMPQHEDVSKQKVIWVEPQALPMGQLELADIAKPDIEKIPEKARFASRYNSSVATETVAKKIPKHADTKTDISEENRASKISSPKTQVAKKKQTTTAPSDLALKPSDVANLAEETRQKDPENKKLTPKDFKPLNLTPTKNDSSNGPGDRFVHDFAPGIKIGDKTYLNAHAFPDVQYFTMLKRIFRIRFNPTPSLRSYFSGHTVAVGKVSVVMAMTVSTSGRLEELFVTQSSGIPEYDQEAMRTVKESAPFSSPPKNILDKDEKLRMTWDFITYL